MGLDELKQLVSRRHLKNRRCNKPLIMKRCPITQKVSYSHYFKFCA